MEDNQNTIDQLLEIVAELKQEVQELRKEVEALKGRETSIFDFHLQGNRSLPLMPSMPLVGPGTNNGWASNQGICPTDNLPHTYPSLWLSVTSTPCDKCGKAQPQALFGNSYSINCGAI